VSVESKKQEFVGKARAIVSAVTKSLKDAIETAPPELRKPAKRLLVGAIVLFVVISGYKFIAYKWEQHRLAVEMAAGPMVRTDKVKKSAGDHTATFIGETRPYESATLYAKVSGYLKKVLVDKGDIVKQGQVLAIIESPETDESYIAAAADAKNKKAIAARMTALLAKRLVSQQEADQAVADSDVSQARLRSTQTLKDYETLRAPFPGTITARFADPGALVQNATSSETSALPVVTISQIRRLRVDVFLDQRDAPFVVKDQPVEISLVERPGFKILGHLDRLSDELDPRTKMLLTEIDIPNEDRSLVAGSFVQVKLQIKAPPYLEAPVESLAVKNDKNYLTVITADNTLTFKPIEVADNDGKILRIISGATEGDTLALNVGDTLPEGNKVRPVVDKPAEGKKP
jgi:RND family efflux transporter MFP subunit